MRPPKKYFPKYKIPPQCNKLPVKRRESYCKNIYMYLYLYVYRNTTQKSNMLPKLLMAHAARQIYLNLFNVCTFFTLFVTVFLSLIPLSLSLSFSLLFFQYSINICLPYASHRYVSFYFRNFFFVPAFSFLLFAVMHVISRIDHSDRGIF